MSDLEPTTPDRTRWIALGALAVVVLALAVVLLLAGDDDDGDDDAVGASSTTTTVTTATTTTSTSTTSTTAATTTSAPKATIPPARCDPGTSPAEPGEPAMAFYDAWRIGDRACAERLGTDAAVDELFDLQPNGPGWEFQGCTEVDQPDPHGDCAFTYEGGSTHFKIVYGEIDGWSIFEVYGVAD